MQDMNGSPVCRRHKDGLLDLTASSTMLDSISKRNASKSTLLRLPGELCNLIWDRALSDINVEVSLTEQLAFKARRISPSGRVLPIRLSVF